jgi:hypothetical protein
MSNIYWRRRRKCIEMSSKYLDNECSGDFDSFLMLQSALDGIACVVSSLNDFRICHYESVRDFFLILKNESQSIMVLYQTNIELYSLHGLPDIELIVKKANALQKGVAAQIAQSFSAL